jgi:tetratricopeptide (TPR) repeat protein
LEKAREDFTSAVSIAPHAAEPRFFLALTQYKLEAYTDAIRVLQVAMKEGIADADLHYLMAECILKIDPIDTPKALSELSHAIELDHDSLSARTLRGKLFLDQGRLKEAIADLELAARLDTTSRSATYNLARAYRAAGRTAEAQTLFTRLRSETGDTLTELGDKRLNQALKQSSSGDPQ